MHVDVTRFREDVVQEAGLSVQEVASEKAILLQLFGECFLRIIFSLPHQKERGVSHGSELDQERAIKVLFSLHWEFLLEEL